ncbi:MAG TPA: hypothetical protein VI942_06975 [Thermoanaerobaculia bacterium]|nr:hypothetical protein [Thermoanaerobaculia bacterium]
MPLEPDAPTADARLAGYLAAADEERARHELGELLDVHASPLVWKVLRRQLGGRGGAPADLEDLHADVLLKLQLHLAAARAGDRDAPSSFLDYVAVSAYNAVAGLQMARQPERTRLRDRVRYVLRREERWASWNGADRELVCGGAEQTGRPAAGAVGERLRDLARAELARTGAGWGRFPRLVAAVLDRLGEPCRVEDLVDALAHVLGVEDHAPVAPESATAEPFDAADDREPDVQARLEAGERVARVWAEIELLPDNQRFALLLNLRGDGGEAMMEDLLATGVVGLPALAASLGLAPDELADLLPGLPKDDQWIAGRLGLSRQQVVNLRKSGRLRLARRLRAVLGRTG